jgi:hypothetical protein
MSRKQGGILSHQLREHPTEAEEVIASTAGIYATSKDEAIALDSTMFSFPSSSDSAKEVAFSIDSK